MTLDDDQDRIPVCSQGVVCFSILLIPQPIAPPYNLSDSFHTNGVMVHSFSSFSVFSVPR